MNAIQYQCGYSQCEREAYARGYCKSHYSKMRKTGELVLKETILKKCSAIGCDRPFSAKGFCEQHYREFKVSQNPMAYKSIEEKRKNRTRALKAQMVAEMGGCCTNCGYRSNIACMDFHHENPEQKDFEPSKLMKSGNIEEIRRELSKCILLCKNCHNDIHHLWGRQECVE